MWLCILKASYYFKIYFITQFQIVAVLVLSIVVDESLSQRGNRPLRQRQRQGRLLAAKNPLGPPPQPAILLSSADPIFLTADERLPSIAQGRQGRQFRRGRQEGSVPDEDGNYNIE